MTASTAGWTACVSGWWPLPLKEQWPCDLLHHPAIISLSTAVAGVSCQRPASGTCSHHCCCKGCCCHCSLLPHVLTSTQLYYPVASRTAVHAAGCCRVPYPAAAVLRAGCCCGAASHCCCAARHCRHAKRALLWCCRRVLLWYFKGAAVALLTAAAVVPHGTAAVLQWRC